MSDLRPMSDLDLIAVALARLDTRRHVCPATLELSRVDDSWQAMIMADPMRVPASARSLTPGGALHGLAVACDRIDWRKVRR